MMEMEFLIFSNFQMLINFICKICIAIDIATVFGTDICTGVLKITKYYAKFQM
jgi:hypothetical protein